LKNNRKLQTIQATQALNETLSRIGVIWLELKKLKK